MGDLPESFPMGHGQWPNHAVKASGDLWGQLFKSLGNVQLPARGWDVTNGIRAMLALVGGAHSRHVSPCS